MGCAWHCTVCIALCIAQEVNVIVRTPMYKVRKERLKAVEVMSCHRKGATVYA